MSEGERLRLEEEALKEAKGLQREIIERGGVLAQPAGKAILSAYALKIMQFEF